jgi:hypothetical protein
MALTMDDDQDYTLDSDSESVWITVGTVSVYIRRQDEGVSVHLYPRGHEDEDAIGATYGAYDECLGGVGADIDVMYPV